MAWYNRAMGSMARAKTGVGLLVAAMAALGATVLARTFAADAPAEREISGEVVAVLDGDTIDVLSRGKATRVRLAGIDCPEKSQRFGMQAKKLASSLCFGRSVRVRATAVDRYGRTVGFVTLPDGRSLNDEMLRAGLAWWYRDYSKDERLGALEREARLARRGLWVDPDPMPPWVWRRHE
ncbi:MAG: thermonuclease family protein [Deltaproteobacteria bacterium]|nr:thermonuclease family protein [Deltaproteobacteria bacterium]